MVDYKIVKFCRMCRVRYVVPKGESKKNYCDACTERFQKQRAEKEAAQAKEKAESGEEIIQKSL